MFIEQSKSGRFNYTENKLGSLEFFSQMISYPCKSFNSIVEYCKTIELLNSNRFNKNLPSIDSQEIQRTLEKTAEYNKRKGKKLSLLYLKSDVCLLTGVSETFIKISIEEHDNNPSYFVSLPGFSWQVTMK